MKTRRYLDQHRLWLALPRAVDAVAMYGSLLVALVALGVGQP
jgi:hypothetical protein